MSVTELSKLTGLSKSYISQVKLGQLPPSQKLIDILLDNINANRKHPDYIALFMKSRDAIGISIETKKTYTIILERFAADIVYVKTAEKELDFYLIELNEPKPWTYAKYHCGSACNWYSGVGWS
jgi:transcriptional regulator with XRE-family HTH domain